MALTHPGCTYGTYMAEALMMVGAILVLIINLTAQWAIPGNKATFFLHFFFQKQILMNFEMSSINIYRADILFTNI